MPEKPVGFSSDKDWSKHGYAKHADGLWYSTATMKTKKKKEKKVKKPEYTEAQLNEVKERVSVFGNKYPVSTPEDWTEYENVGWSHKSELARFLDCYRQCNFNKKWYSINKISRTVQGFPISMDEIKANNWIKCGHSEYWVTKEDAVEAHIGTKRVKIAKRYIEEGLYFTCDLSQKVYSRHSKINVRGSNQYRQVAKEEIDRTGLIRKCETCGNWMERAQVEYRDWERGRTMACITCHNRENARNLIRPHNYAEYPRPIHKQVEFYRCYDHGTSRRFKKVEDVGIRLFGVEVETEMSKKSCMAAAMDRFSLARGVKDTLGSDFVLIKEDGSLSLNGHYADGRTGSTYAGFEIVTAPADIEVHRSRWPLLEKMAGFEHLRAWNTETCGMHVHVSKDALTTLQIGRILMLMTHNNNKKFIAKVAGRSENKYCRAYHKEKFSDGIQYGESEVRNGVEYVQAGFYLPRSDDARRQAVNITNPRTIEFRIFRGTVHPRHIIRNIEFADAVCSFCHPGSRSLKELGDYANLVHYIAENRKAYPLLVEWMESPEISILPPRNAYGPKDTRGSKRPEVVEATLGKEKLEDPFVEAGLIPPAEAPRIRWANIPARVPARLVRDNEANVIRPMNADEIAREARRARRNRDRLVDEAVAGLRPRGAMVFDPAAFMPNPNAQEAAMNAAIPPWVHRLDEQAAMAAPAPIAAGVNGMPAPAPRDEAHEALANQAMAELAQALDQDEEDNPPEQIW